MFLRDPEDDLVFSSSRVPPASSIRFFLFSCTFASKLAPCHDVFFPFLLAPCQFAFASALVVAFLCPQQRSDVPLLWFAPRDTLVSMISLDFTKQRARVETTGVRHDVVNHDDIPQAALPKRYWYVTSTRASGSCAFTGGLHLTAPSVSPVHSRFHRATDSQRMTRM